MTAGSTDYTQAGANPIVLGTSYVQSLSIDSKIARVTASTGATHYYVPDALGSVHALLDSSQSRQNLQLTTAWGEPIPGFSSSSSVSDRYGLAGREKDSESGLMHFRARAYDPRLGRFVQTESVLGNRPRKHYVYAANNPSRFKDPHGTQEELANPVETLPGAALLAEFHATAILVGRGAMVRIPLTRGRTAVLPAGAWLGVVASEVAFRRELRAQLERHEGRRTRVYRDTANNRTIGVGFNLERGDAAQRIANVGANFEDVREGRADLTEQQVDQLLTLDIDDSIAASNRQVNNYRSLPVAARLVVVDMVFNLGEAGFGGFRNMRRALEARNWRTAADEMVNSRWYRQVGNRGRTLEQLMRSLVR